MLLFSLQVQKFTYDRTSIAPEWGLEPVLPTLQAQHCTIRPPCINVKFGGIKKKVVSSTYGHSGCETARQDEVGMNHCGRLSTEEDEEEEDQEREEEEHKEEEEDADY